MNTPRHLNEDLGEFVNRIRDEYEPKIILVGSLACEDVYERSDIDTDLIIIRTL